MITQFDRYDKHPEKGDYIVGIPLDYDQRSHYSQNNWNKLINFIETHIGRVILVYFSAGYGENTCRVVFDDNNFDGRDYFTYSRSDIEFWSKNKEDVEEYKMTKKYNL